MSDKLKDYVYLLLACSFTGSSDGEGCWEVDLYSTPGQSINSFLTEAKDEGWRCKDGKILCPGCAEREVVK